MDAPSPDPADLVELGEKYRVLGELRTQRDTSDTQAARATLQALAARHPGCLRELDTLGPVELQRRAAAARTAAAGGPREPWMAWIWAYHRVMRATLACKRAIGRAGLREDEVETLAAQARQIAGFVLDDRFVRAVASPPQGRVGVVVLRQLGELFATPADTIASVLFPRRRPAPYTL